MGPAGRVEETAPEADSVQQDSAFRLEGSNLLTPRVLPSLDCQEAQRHLVGAWAPQRNCTETLPLLERDARCPHPEFSRTAHFGGALGSHRTHTFLPPPGHSLGFPATSAWSQGPPCAQGNVSGFPRRLRLRLPVQLLTLCRVSVSVFGGLLRQPTRCRRLSGKF